MDALARISRRLARRVDALRFAPPVTTVYDPLVYARRSHEAYLARWGRGQKQILVLGMNPGPFGMAQTGVPFGDVEMVRGFLGIEANVERPAREHPRRPVLGFSCPRSEVSGTRLWGWIRHRFGTAERFFRRGFVANYCPLAFMEASGRNLTPDRLPVGERAALFSACDDALRACAAELRPRVVVGVGAFAASRARLALGGVEVRVLPHPSPASPAANRGWAALADRALADLFS